MNLSLQYSTPSEMVRYHEMLKAIVEIIDEKFEDVRSILPDSLLASITREFIASGKLADQYEDFKADRAYKAQEHAAVLEEEAARQERGEAA